MPAFTAGNIPIYKIPKNTRFTFAEGDVGMGAGVFRGQRGTLLRDAEGTRLFIPVGGAVNFVWQFPWSPWMVDRVEKLSGGKGYDIKREVATDDTISSILIEGKEGGTTKYRVWNNFTDTNIETGTVGSGQTVRVNLPKIPRVESLRMPGEFAVPVAVACSWKKDK